MRYFLLFVSLSTSISFAKILPKEAAKLVKENKATIIDVREEDEIVSGMAAPAVWLPTSAIEAKNETYKKTLSSLDKSKTIAVYCARGGRAEVFVEALRKEGFKAENMGGFKDWQSAGLPVKRP